MRSYCHERPPVLKDHVQSTDNPSWKTTAQWHFIGGCDHLESITFRQKVTLSRQSGTFYILSRWKVTLCTWSFKGDHLFWRIMYKVNHCVVTHSWLLWNFIILNLLPVFRDGQWYGLWPWLWPMVWSRSQDHVIIVNVQVIMVVIKRNHYMATCIFRPAIQPVNGVLNFTCMWS